MNVLFNYLKRNLKSQGIIVKKICFVKAKVSAGKQVYESLSMANELKG